MSSLWAGGQKFAESNNKYSFEEYKSFWPKTATQPLRRDNVPIFQAQIRARRRNNQRAQKLCQRQPGHL